MIPQKENKATMGIKKKLICAIVPSVILVVFIIFFITYYTSKKSIVSITLDNIVSDTKYNSAKIENWTLDVLATLNNIQMTLEHANLSKEQKREYLRTTVGLNQKYPLGVYMGGADNSYMDPSDWAPDKDYVVSERTWFQEGLQHEKFEFGRAYIDAKSGQYIVSASAKLHMGDTNQVAAADVFLQEISDEVAKVQLLDTGYAMLVDNITHEIIAHKESEELATRIDKSEDILLQNINKIIQKGHFGSTLVKSKKDSYYVAVEPVDGVNWTLVTCVPEREVLKDLISLRRIMVGMMILAFALISLVTERLVHYVVKPIKKLTDDISRITTGDFTVQVETKGKDEVAVMSRGLHRFVAVMRDMIKSIKQCSGELNYQADKGSQVSHELYEISEKQSLSMGELDATIEEMAKSVVEVTENATILANHVQDTKESGQVVQETMRQTVMVSKQGYENMAVVQNEMTQLVHFMEELKHAVVQVGKSSTEIGTFVEMIDQISEQTNLLSLNASIEAARAGEAGKGFAVVAQEIRNLAITSATSVQNISELANSIQRVILTAVEKTEEGVEQINQSSNKITDAYDNFGFIYDTIQTANQKVKEMIQAIHNMDEVATNVAAITQEQSAGTQEILATTQHLSTDASKVTSHSEQVALDANTLTKAASELAVQMERFKVDREI